MSLNKISTTKSYLVICVPQELVALCSEFIFGSLEPKVQWTGIDPDSLDREVRWSTASYYE